MPYLSKLSLQDERILATARGLENAMVPVWFVLWFYAPLHGSTSTSKTPPWYRLHFISYNISHHKVHKTIHFPWAECGWRFHQLCRSSEELARLPPVEVESETLHLEGAEWVGCRLWKVKISFFISYTHWLWVLGSGTDMSFTFVDCLPAGCIWDVVQGEQEASKPTASRSLPSFGSSNYSSRQLRNAWLCCRYASRKYTHIFFAQWWPSFVFWPPLNIALSSSLPVDWTPSAAIGAPLRLKVNNGSLYRGHRYVGVWASWNSWNWKERASCVAVGEVKGAEWKTRASRRSAGVWWYFFTEFQKPQASCEQFLQPLALDQEW
jgi:hypothetical protein